MNVSLHREKTFFLFTLYTQYLEKKVEHGVALIKCLLSKWMNSVLQKTLVRRKKHFQNRDIGPFLNVLKKCNTVPMGK